MDAISYTAARTNLAKTMEQVCENHSPVIITRNKAQSVVMISLEDYEALQEIAYLVRAPKNARRLLESGFIEPLQIDHASAIATMPMYQGNNAFTQCRIAVRGRLLVQCIGTHADDTERPALA